MTNVQTPAYLQNHKIERVKCTSACFSDAAMITEAGRVMEDWLANGTLTGRGGTICLMGSARTPCVQSAMSIMILLTVYVQQKQLLQQHEEETMMTGTYIGKDENHD